jgi:hypothetical protein
MVPSAFLACMVAAAQFHGLPPRVLPAIWATEGGRPGLVMRNRNGTEDLGLMQINTVWLPAVARAARQPPEVVRQRLIEDGCFSVHVAAAILRQHADRGGVMRAIGNYHSRTPALHTAYQERVLANAIRLFETPRPPPREPRRQGGSR